MEELSHELRRLAAVTRVPLGSHDQEVGADEAKFSVGGGFVDDDLGMRGINDAAIYESTIHVVQAHRAKIGPADASELKRIAFGLGGVNIFKTLGGFTNSLNQRVGLRVGGEFRLL